MHFDNIRILHVKHDLLFYVVVSYNLIPEGIDYCSSNGYCDTGRMCSEIKTNNDVRAPLCHPICDPQHFEYPSCGDNGECVTQLENDIAARICKYV